MLTFSEAGSMYLNHKGFDTIRKSVPCEVEGIRAIMNNYKDINQGGLFSIRSMQTPKIVQINPVEKGAWQ